VFVEPCLLKAVNNGLKVLYIDADRKIEQSAIYNFVHKNPKWINNVTVIDIKNHKELETTINKIPDYIKDDNIDVVIVDSIYTPFVNLDHRVSCRKIRYLASKLKEFADNKIVIITTHGSKQYDSLNKIKSEIAKGGDTLQYLSNHRINIRKGKKGMRIMSYNERCELSITFDYQGFLKFDTIFEGIVNGGN